MNCTLVPMPVQSVAGRLLPQRLRVALATALLGLTPLPAANFPADLRESDQLLAFQAKTVLGADPILHDMNLTVSVLDGVVLVGGPVSDATIPRRVEQILRTLPGVQAVKVNCWVVAGEDRFGSRVRSELENPQAALPPLALPTTPGSGFNRSRLMALQPGIQSPANSAEVVTQRLAQPVHAGLLLDPIAPNSAQGVFSGIGVVIPATPANSAISYPTIPPQEVPLSPMNDQHTDRRLDADSVAKIGRIRASDPRFGWLTIQLQGDDVIISGRAWKPQDAWDYAEALRTVPGIGRIVIGTVNPR